MKKIFILRHAEKPDGTNHGVDNTGNQDPDSLIPQGWQRAGALATFFSDKGTLPAPNCIYAAADEKEKLGHHDKDGSSSKRPMETVTPLAAKLGQTLVTKYTKGEETELAAEVVGLSGITVICWQHEDIPQIAIAITGSSKGIPSPWPGDRFDVVWCFESTGGTWAFTQVCQELLAGDKTTPIS
jgi:hypothetical protein